MTIEVNTALIEDLRGPLGDELLSTLHYRDAENVVGLVVKELADTLTRTGEVDMQLWNLLYQVTCRAREVWEAREDDTGDYCLGRNH